MVEMLEWWTTKVRYAARPSSAAPRFDVVRVVNDSGGNRNRWDVLEITGPFSDPVAGDTSDDRALSLLDFQAAVAVRGGTPSVGGLGKFVVLYEPVAAGEIGYGYLAGVCQARINIVSETDVSADLTPGDPSMLTSGSGPAAILWKQEPADRTGGYAWAIVRLGGGGGAGMQIHWARLKDFSYDGPVAVAFTGVLVDQFAGEVDEDAEDITIYALKWPWITSLANDLRFAVPGVPLDYSDGRSDVMVALMPDARDDGMPKWWIVNPDFIGRCA